MAHNSIVLLWQYFNKWPSSNGSNVGSVVIWFPGAGDLEAWVESRAKSQWSLWIMADCQSLHMLRWHWAPFPGSVIGLLWWRLDQRVNYYYSSWSLGLMDRKGSKTVAVWEQDKHTLQNIHIQTTSIVQWLYIWFSLRRCKTGKRNNRLCLEKYHTHTHRAETGNLTSILKTKWSELKNGWPWPFPTSQYIRQEFA